MVKKIYIAAFMVGLSVLVAGKVYGDVPLYGSTHCGFANEIWNGDPSGTANALGAITNATSGPTYTFAMSSQTSGCSDKYGELAYLNEVQKTFVSVNYSSLKQEAAVGKGENLNAFASLLGCPAQSSFADMTQKNHAYFFSVPKNEPAAFVSRIKAKIQTDSKLSAACKSQA